MDDEVTLRAVELPDLELFFAQEHDPEATRRSKFPPRDRDRFMTHWTTKVLADPSNLVRTITAGGEPAGSIMAWWEGDRRFIGYWLGREFWGRGVGTRALTLLVLRAP